MSNNIDVTNKPKGVILTILIHKTHVVLRTDSYYVTTILDIVCEKLTIYKYIWNPRTKRNIREKDKGYFALNRELGEYRFPITIFKDILLTLGSNGLKRDHIEIRYIEPAEGTHVDFKWNDEFVPRDYQMEYINILLNEDMPIMLVDLATGKGKSLILMKYLHTIKKRTAILVLPKYIDKWIEDVKKYSDLTDDDFYVVQGGTSLERLCSIPTNEITYKYIIFSMTTITNYITDYENDELTLDVPSPQNLMEKLGISVLANDESHQHFHALFKTILYFNVERVVGMTATLVSNRNEVNRIYNTLFPAKARISNLVKHEPYVNVEAVQYELNTWRKVRYQTVQGYSHVTYEDYIMSHNLFLNSYLELIEEFFKKRYINNRTPGDRCLIYCSTIRMCTIVANYLKERYKDLSIGTYVESDSYESIMSNDVSVSTLGSASTGLDIKGLTTVINTISVTSMQSNLQSLGRLRKIEGKELWYVYLYCKNIPKQIKMHKDRKVAIEKTVKSYIYTTYYKILKVR